MTDEYLARKKQEYEDNPLSCKKCDKCIPFKERKHAKLMQFIAGCALCVKCTPMIKNLK